MARAETYLSLQQAIADEMGDRQDLLSPLSDSSLSLSPIKSAIQSAIAFWEREPFYFNSAYPVQQFATVAGQELYTKADYAALATLPEIDKAQILVDTVNRYTLTRRTWQYVEDTSVSLSARGMPVDYAYFAQQLRLYPIPDMAYPVTLTCYQRFANLANDTDANVWTQDAYDLIRTTAKMILAQETTHDPDMATECKTAIYGDPPSPFTRIQNRGYYFALKAETTRREATGRVRPTMF